MRIESGETMKTRDDIYVEEKEVIRIISAYRVLLRSQLCRLFPHKSPATVGNMLRKLARGKRLYVDWEHGYVAHNETLLSTVDMGLIQSFWLLLEFIGKITYHAPAEFPVKIFCITEKDTYEILYVGTGQENLINAHFINRNSQDICKRFVIVEDIAQIPLLKVPAVASYCTISDGTVSYFTY